ncbi:uncharacterized protein LOC143258645 isoform X2 [Tachypleus tridentatus]|uniref:uncharacterized protein LOC143258645 isoform X2 n=1 Tax=Tachypleus tridentatus TaxID=6853 RepID=UPI003FD30F97
MGLIMIVKKHQQRVFMILDSLKLNYETIDITEPGKEDQRTYMRENCKKGAGGGVLPPQFFNDEDYLGDYDDFELANEDDELMKFLKLEDQVPKEDITSSETKFQATEPENTDELIFQNGTGSREASESKEVSESSKTEVTEEETVSEENQAATEEEPETKEGEVISEGEFLGEEEKYEQHTGSEENVTGKSDDCKMDVEEGWVGDDEKELAENNLKTNLELQENHVSDESEGEEET